MIDCWDWLGNVEACVSCFNWWDDCWVDCLGGTTCVSIDGAGVDCVGGPTYVSIDGVDAGCWGGMLIEFVVI